MSRPHGIITTLFKGTTICIFTSSRSFIIFVPCMILDILLDRCSSCGVVEVHCMSWSQIFRNFLAMFMYVGPYFTMNVEEHMV